MVMRARARGAALESEFNQATTAAEVLGALSMVNRMGGRAFYFPSASLLKMDLSASSAPLR